MRAVCPSWVVAKRGWQRQRGVTALLARSGRCHPTATTMARRDVVVLRERRRSGSSEAVA